MHRGDHMILTVSAIVHDDEPDLVRRYSKLLSRRILGERIRFAITVSHCDRFKRTSPFARRRLNHEIDRYVEMAQQRFVPILANLFEFLRQRRYRWALSVLGFLALVKVGFLKLHLIPEGLPYSHERSILVEFCRVVSEWVTGALLLSACRQHHEANCYCDECN